MADWKSRLTLLFNFFNIISQYFDEEVTNISCRKVGDLKSTMIVACCLLVGQKFSVQFLSRATTAVLRRELNSSFVGPFPCESFFI